MHKSRQQKEQKWIGRMYLDQFPLLMITCGVETEYLNSGTAFSNKYKTETKSPLPHQSTNHFFYSVATIIISFRRIEGFRKPTITMFAILPLKPLQNGSCRSCDTQLSSRFLVLDRVVKMVVVRPRRSIETIASFDQWSLTIESDGSKIKNH